MEEAKQRNKDHIRNKRKYKPKSFKDPKYVLPKSTRNLESNWDRYENITDTQEFQLTSNTDFSILASAPISKGHHFQFKSDKCIAEEIEAKVPAELFYLDLDLLRNGILTVPFYQRVGISSEYFTENQLKFMNRDADINLNKYNDSYIKDKETFEEPANAVNSKEDKNHCTVDEVSTENQQKHVSTTVPAATHEIKKTDEDLEEWLDDILDD